MPMPRTRNEWVTALFVAAPLAPLALAAQGTPLEAFRSNIAAIHARNRAAYLSHYLHSPALARVGPDGLRQGYDDFARGDGAAWPDTLVATHLRIVPLSPDIAYGVYRYRVVDSGASVRGVSWSNHERFRFGCWSGSSSARFMASQLFISRTEPPGREGMAID